MPYDLEDSLLTQLGPKNRSRFEAAVATYQEANTKVNELSSLLDTRRKEQNEHAVALVTVDIGTDPHQLSTSYGLRSAMAEVVGKIEEELALAKQRRNEARDNLSRLVGTFNNLASGASGWRQRGDLAYAEADKLVEQLNQ